MDRIILMLVFVPQLRNFFIFYGQLHGSIGLMICLQKRSKK